MKLFFPLEYGYGDFQKELITFIWSDILLLLAKNH